jgi:hypothetical protein
MTSQPTEEITFEGRAIEIVAGESLLLSLLRAGSQPGGCLSPERRLSALPGDGRWRRLCAELPGGGAGRNGRDAAAAG